VGGEGGWGDRTIPSEADCLQDTAKGRRAKSYSRAP